MLSFIADFTLATCSISISYIFAIAKDNHNNQRTQKFKGLLEVITSEAVILTAIHNIKSNKGSKTVGIDKNDINNILQGDFDENISHMFYI